MPEYRYRNEAEKERTQKYEGAYSPAEADLNATLKEECSKDVLDFEKVEDLLKQGADPLGGTAICGWDLLDHVYGELIAESQYDDSVNLPRLTKLFLKYGMNVDAPRIPYDGEFSLNPLWHLAHAINENSISALKMLLDHGLSADSFADFWGHAITDFYILDSGDPQNDKFWSKECGWTLRMMLLGASYDHIILDDEALGEFLCLSYNTSDIHAFRDWNAFDYFFDTSHCDYGPNFFGSILHIYSKATGKEVWTIGVGRPGRKTLDAILQANEMTNEDVAESILGQQKPIRTKHIPNR